MERVLSKHRHGSKVPGKTWFPPSWSDEDIQRAIHLSLQEPHEITPFGDKLGFEKVVQQVLAWSHVRVDTDPPIFWNSYPPHGEAS